MTGKKRRQVTGDRDGAHAGTAATMRDAEGFVEVEMANVGAEIARATEADLGVHVGAVHVNLAAVAVYDFANFANRCFENTVCGRVCHHQRG